jgi:hypothetical protein
MGVLFRHDIFAWGRIYEELCQPTWKSSPPEKSRYPSEIATKRLSPALLIRSRTLNLGMLLSGQQIAHQSNVCARVHARSITDHEDLQTEKSGILASASSCSCFDRHPCYRA